MGRRRSALLAAGQRWRAGQSGGAAPDLVLDWDTGDNSQWLTGVGGLECGEPNHQSTFSQTVRRGATGWAWRAEVHDASSDQWAGNGSMRCLLGKYDSCEGPPGAQGPSDLAWAFSFRVAQEASVTARLDYTLIWELHHRSNMYNVPGLSLAPHAVELMNGNVYYRCVAGAGNWNGSSWTGWSTYLRDQLLLSNFQMDTWYDMVIRVKCSETDGIAQVWIRAAGQAFSSTPQFSHNGPTLPFVPGGLDPAVPTKRSTADPVGSPPLTGLYLETGLYHGGNSWDDPGTPQHVLYMDGMRRYPTSASAQASFPAGSGGGPVVHSSSPARVTGSTNSGTNTVTTGTFNPPASVLVATVQMNMDVASAPTGAMSNNGAALTWTMVGERTPGDAGGSEGYAAIFTAPLSASRTGMTVTFTASGTTAEFNSPSLKLYVVTGANLAAPNGGSNEGASTDNNLTTTGFTTTGASSLGFVSANDWNALESPSSSDSILDHFTNIRTTGVSGYKTLGTAGSSATFNIDSTSMVREVVTASSYTGPGSVVSLNTGAGTQVGDLLVAFCGANYYSAPNTAATPGGNAGTWTARANPASESNRPHLAIFTCPVGTAGARTVSYTVGTGLNVDCAVHLTVYVLRNVHATTPVVGASVQANTAGTTAWVAPSVACASGDLLLCDWQTFYGGETGGTGAAPTIPASMSLPVTTPLVDQSIQRSARELIVSGTTTGTRTAAASVAGLAYSAGSITIRSAGTPGPAMWHWVAAEIKA